MRARVQTPHILLGRAGTLGQLGQLGRRDARTGGPGEGGTVSGYDVWGCRRPPPPTPLSEKIHPGGYGVPITSSERVPLTHSINQWASHNLERARPITS